MHVGMPARSWAQLTQNKAPGSKPIALLKRDTGGAFMNPKATHDVGRPFLFFLILLVTAHLSYGQAIDGRLVGTLIDASDAVIGGAQVTVTNEATGISWKAQTDGHGNYVVPSLPPGIYTVK